MPIESTERNDLDICRPVNGEHPVKKGSLQSGDIHSGIRSKKWCPRMLFAALLIFCTLFAYVPSMDMVFMNDQLSYFLELDGETSLASGFKLLDYGAQRQYNKGDEVLYRPLLFVFLAFENSLLKRNFKLWNFVNLGLHIFLVYLLFEFLWRIKPTSLAFGLALLFGLLMSNFALVTLNHLGGYLIGYGLLLTALWAAREMGSKGESSDLRWFWIYGFAITGAMLFHEIAVVASLSVLAYVMWCRRKQFNIKKGKYAIALGVPILIYAMLYSSHVWNCERLLWIDTHDANNLSISSLVNVPLLIYHWLRHIFLPVSDQFVFAYMNFSSWSMPDRAWLPQMIIPGMLWIVTLICLRQGFDKKHFKEALPFSILIFFWIVSYAGMNVLGRSSNSFQITHYDYFPALFGAVLLYAWIDFSRIHLTKKMLAMICLVLLVFYNGVEIRKTSCLVQEMYKPLGAYLELVERKVRPKLIRPDSSFFIKELPPELDIRMQGLVGYPDEENLMEISLLSALYGKYYNSKNPTDVYVIKKIRPDKLDLLTVRSFK